MTRGEHGYAMLLTTMSLLLLTAISSIMVIATFSELQQSQRARHNLQAQYLAEMGLDGALGWFRSSYILVAPASLDTAPASPPVVTDPLAATFAAPVALTGGGAVVINGATTGTATTHPTTYTNAAGQTTSNILTSFASALSNKAVPLGTAGLGTFSVMAVLVDTTPETWRIDSVAQHAGKTQSASVYIERLPITPSISAALTSGSPVDVSGNQEVDGRDHALDGTLNGNPGQPGISTTSENPLPTVSGAGEVTSISSGTVVTVENGATVPNPAPADYPVNNTLDKSAFPYSPAAALGLDPATHGPYIEKFRTTALPCTLSGLVYLDIDFPTGNAPGGCSYSGSGVLIVHNPRYDPRYFDPADALYSSATSPVPGQTAAQYRLDSANRPRYFNYNASNTFKGIIIADSIGEIGPGISGNASILGGVIALDRVNGSIGSGNAKIYYSSPAIDLAESQMPYTRKPATYRSLRSQ